VGVGLHERFGTLQGVVDGGIAARRDAAYQHQQQNKMGEISAQEFHSSVDFCCEDTTQLEKMQE